MAAPTLRMIDAAQEPEDQNGWERVLDGWRVGRSGNTLRAYTNDLAAFTAYMGAQGPCEALAQLVVGGIGSAAATLTEWIGAQEEAGAATSSIHRRVSAIRSILKLAHAFGVVEWSDVQVRTPVVRRKRNVTAPTEFEVRDTLFHMSRIDTWQGRRDYALVRLMADLALRIGSCLSADLEHLDLAAGTLTVRLKGRGEIIKTKALPPATVRALDRWVEVRGQEPGPLFLGARSGERLDPRCARDVVAKAGLKRPHALRRYATDRAIRYAAEHGLPLTDVMDYTDHGSLEMLNVYRRELEDSQGMFAAAISAINSYE